MKKTKRALLLSIISIALCVLMLGGIIAAGYNALSNNNVLSPSVDKENNLPVVKPKEDIDSSASAKVEVTDDNKTVANVELESEDGEISASIPSGTLLNEGVNEVTLTVEKIDNSEANIEINDNEVTVSYNVHIEGVSSNNQTPIKVYIKELLPVGLNMGNYKFYHVENGNTVEMTLLGDNEPVHNNFDYDSTTGDCVLYLASFSEVAVIADTENAWNGTYDYEFVGDGTQENPYIISSADELAGFGAIVGGMNGQARNSYEGKFVKLVADINLGDKDNANENLIFYPIGYYYNGNSSAPESTVYSFEGTFDGNGHTIANFYHNTWEIKGDYDANYYKDAMGLFGYVLNGKIENLTVDSFSSDGEFTPTGVIAAFADGDSTFKNIAITNCNPRVYNTGNGGIIGIAGDTSAENDDHITLENITVDNTNKISALWGSWDVACGGLVGMYRGNVNGSGEATGDTISFTNCHVAAQIDVYNDVCANYQYYAYRYAGMIIGSIRHNTKNDAGRVIPNMAGVSASGCTVNYGDWNDYYYCEFVKNSPASYSEDYQFSRVDKSEIIFDAEGNITGCVHEHTDEEDKTAVYLPFHQLFTGYSWGVSSIGLEKYSGIVTNLDIIEGDQNESVVKFDKLFTGDFLYRVGNGNAVSLSSLFASKDGVTINSSGVWVTITPVDENSSASGTFSANNDAWASGTIQFNGTGVVKVTIQDYNYCTPTELYLEVVDATNATGATNATSNNVVLLKDCSFSSIEVSGGYTLFGNGFTMTCGSDSYAADLGYSFVTLDNGTLDNVQIVCPNFDYAALYKSNLTSADNRSYTDTNGTTRYYNARSGVMVSGNSQILNSRISGARAAVNVSSGNLLIDNSRIEYGAVANILVGAANSLVLKDVTLIQEPVESTYKADGVNGTKVMGFSVLFICNSEGDAAPCTIEGAFVQNAWVDESDSEYVPSAGQSVISTVLSNENFIHDLDNDGTRESLNLGFAYMPDSTTSPVNDKTISDNRTNKDSIPYDYAEVSIPTGTTYVYSYKYNENEVIPSEFTKTDDYIPNKYSDIITVTYSDTSDGLTSDKSFGTDGWVFEINVDLDKLNGYALDFSKLSMNVNGVAISDYLVNDGAKPTSPVAVVAGGTTYKLTAVISDKEYTAYFKVIGTEASKDSPSIVATNYKAAILVGEAGSTLSKDTWHGAAPALKGIQIRYWSVAEKQYKTINLADYTPTTAGKQNGTNTTWTYTPDNGDFTLTLTGGQVHSSNNVDAMPVVCNETLYFVAASSNGLVNYGNSARTIPVTYSFKDNNGGTELTFSYTWSIECTDGDIAYDYSNFCDGTSTAFTIESSNGDVCVTSDTLVTLADGSQKRVDQVTYEDELLVWDFFNGTYATVPASIIFYHGDHLQNVLKLNFADGTSVKVINNHGFFDVEENKFVFIDEENAESFIGHSFVKVDGDSYSFVQFESFETIEEYTGSYSIQTAMHNNFVVEGMFSITMPAYEGWFDYFEIGDNMKYDEAKMQEDIEKYGLYTYDDFSEYVTYEQFIAFNGPYLKVLVGRGVVTYEQILELISTYVQ